MKFKVWHRHPALAALCPVLWLQAYALSSRREADVGNLRHRHKVQETQHCPSMFAAVFSRQDSHQRRQALRDQWISADTMFDRSDDSSDSSVLSMATCNGWTDNLIARFAICSPDGSLPQKLQAESEQYGDILPLECEEGYGNGLLTKKTLAAMQAYMDSFSDQALFMKVDDDTFVNRKGLCNYIQKHMAPTSLDFSYMGVVTPSAGVAKPHRNKDSQFYEPIDVYPNATYPPSMNGGPGYILGHGLVQHLLSNNIPEDHMIWTEDKAVGVWVYELEQKGQQVNWLDIPGTSGYDRFWKDKGNWEAYTAWYLLRHKISAKAINCLTHLACKDDPRADVAPCFSDS